MKNKLLMVLMTILSLNANAQWQWAKQIQGPSSEVATSMCYNGDVYSAGVFNSSSLSIGTCPSCTAVNSNPGDWDAYITRHNSNTGSPSWVRTVSGPYQTNIYEIASTGSDIFVVGNFGTTITTNSASFVGVSGTIVLNSTTAHPNLFIGRARTSDGKFIWATKPGSQPNFTEYANAVTVNGSNLYMAWYRFNAANLNETFVSKINKSNGLPLWSAKVTHSNISKIVADANGNVFAISTTIVAGVNPIFYNANGSVYSTPAPGSYIVKYNSSGNIVWIQHICLNPNSFTNFMSMDVDFQGNIYLGGIISISGGQTAYFGACGNTTPGTFLTSQGSNGAFLAKYKSGNNIDWVRYVGVGTESLLLRSAETNFYTGETFVVGDGYSGNLPNNAISCITLAPNGSNNSSYVAKFSTTGNVIWAKEMLPGGINGNQADAVCVDQLGYGYVSGSFKQSMVLGATTLNSQAGSFDTYVAKINTLANAGIDKCSNGAPSVLIGTPAQAGCTYSWTGPAGFPGSTLAQPTVSITGTYTVTVTYVGNNGTCIETDVVFVEIGSVQECTPERLQARDMELNIYPNPSSDNVLITIPTDIGSVLISIYNSQGKLVVSKMSEESQININLSNQSDGLYLVKIETSDGASVIKRLVVAH